MDPLKKSQVGKTALYVTNLGLGCSGLPRSQTINQAIETFQTAIKQGINYLDTAPLYGRGKSETRLGKALSNYYGEKLVISTKVGRMLRVPSGGDPNSPEAIYDYSGKAVLNSLESSLERLGVEVVDILFIHDPDNHYEQAINEAYPALAELRDDGIIKAIGAGMNQWEMELRFAQEGEFDCFLLAGRYTLLEQGALDSFLPYCEKEKISVIIGGPYNSGILASPKTGRYNYREPPAEVVAKTIKLKEVCDKYNVPLRAAALQFVLAHPAVASVIPGTRSPRHQEDNYRMVTRNIPKALWDELHEKNLIEPNAPVPKTSS
jgi:D-threo-aldose 1-dehydrogenase